MFGSLTPDTDTQQVIANLVKAMQANQPQGMHAPYMPQPAAIGPQAQQQQQQQSSMSPNMSMLRRFMNRGATPQSGGYTVGSAPTGGYGGYPGYAQTLPGFDSGAGIDGEIADWSGYGSQAGGYTLAGAPEGGYGGYAGYASTLPGFGADAGASGGAATGGGSAAGGAGGGLGGFGAFATPLAYAALIGAGKNTEYNHPNTPEGDASLGLLGPSAAQIVKDPIGMGLPTLLGVPFITPFTGSDAAKKTKPEWSSIFGLGF